MEIYRLVAGEPTDIRRLDDWNLVRKTHPGTGISGYRGTLSGEGKEANVNYLVHLQDEEMAHLLTTVMEQPDLFPKTAAAANQLDARWLRNTLDDRVWTLEDLERSQPGQGYQQAADALKAVLAYLTGNQDPLKIFPFTRPGQ